MSEKKIESRSGRGDNKTSLVERKVIDQNGTLYVSIPAAFVQRFNIRAGDKLPMILSGGMIKVVPHEKPA